jgi:hypothetical protein
MSNIAENIIGIRREAEKVIEQERDQFSTPGETGQNSDPVPKFSRAELLERIDSTSDIYEPTGDIAKGEVYADSESNHLVAAWSKLT